jgi:hypothetical protein
LSSSKIRSDAPFANFKATRSRFKHQILAQSLPDEFDPFARIHRKHPPEVAANLKPVTAPEFDEVASVVSDGQTQIAGRSENQPALS